jgi:hypothetical protein
VVQRLRPRPLLPLRRGRRPGRPALFTEEILEETETTITKRQWDGAIIQDNKGWHKSIPHEIRPAVTCRAEWDRLRDWMDVGGPLLPPTEPGVANTLAQARAADVPVRLGAGSLLGMPRNWLGFEAFAMLPYDDPEWFEEMLETQCRAAERQIRYFGDLGVPLECIHFWEDICFKNGPIVSPDIFREFALPRYRRIVDLAASYGYTQISVDSDGNIEALQILGLGRSGPDRAVVCRAASNIAEDVAIGLSRVTAPVDMSEENFA